VELLKKVGALADVEKAAASKNLRRGKGKMRNRRYVQRKGPLVIYGSDSGIRCVCVWCVCVRGGGGGRPGEKEVLPHKAGQGQRAAGVLCRVLRCLRYALPHTLGIPPTPALACLPF
jgi:hypothetical protein